VHAHCYCRNGHADGGACIFDILRFLTGRSDVIDDGRGGGSARARNGVAIEFGQRGGDADSLLSKE
jgi:hypothetical protein